MTKRWGLFTILFIIIVTVLLRSTLLVHPMPSVKDLLQNPLPKPKFITQIDSETIINHDTSPRICLWVREYDIWEPGDEGSDVNRSISKTSQVFIDGQERSQEDLIFISDLLLMAHCFNGNLSNCEGSHGGTSSICFSTANLAVGQHVADVEFQSTTGKEFSYMWVFELISKDEVIAEVVTTPVP